MKKTLVAAAYLFLSTFAYPVEKKVTLFQMTEETPIEALVWTKREILSAAEGRILLTGEFREKDKNLFLNGKRIVLDSKSNFKLVIVLNRKMAYSFFPLVAKGSDGKTQAQTVVLGIDEGTAPHTEELKKQKFPPVQAVSDFSGERPPEPLRWQASIFTGVGIYSISQPGIPDVSDAYHFVEGRGELIVFRDFGLMGIDAHSDTFKLLTGVEGRSLWMLSFFPHAGGRFPAVFGEKSVLQVNLGLLYSTSYANTNDFGYSDFYSPALEIKGAYALSDRVEATWGIRYAMAKTVQCHWAPSNAEWTLEAEMKVKEFMAHTVGFFFRYGSLNLKLPSQDPLYRHTGFLLGVRLFVFDSI